MANTDADKLPVKAGGIDAVTIVRQFALIFGVAAAVAIGFWIFSWMQEPNYGVLYGNLDKSEAGQILDALQQLNIPYKLDDSTGAILVPSQSIPDARIKLASQGLPKSTIGGGFANLLTQDNTFGISESKENLIYQKALEQELARTISSLSNVKAARIHLAIPKQSVFLRNRRKPRASVIVSLYAGRRLSDGQVAAISHLVSSSVPNLDVDNVTVVDQKGRLLTDGEQTSEMALSSTQFDYARKLEKNYIERIENILIPILGADAVRAQVTADIDFTYNEQTQELYNPDSKVPVSEQITEEQSSGKTTGGVPGALSNQPPAAAEVPEKSNAKGTTTSTSPNSRSSRKETRNFEIDKTISHTRYAMGRVKRLSAAVVVDDKVLVNNKGKRTRIARSPEEINRITELVKKAIGFNIQRGDSVNVINESFTEPLIPEALPPKPLWEQSWLWDAVKQVMGGLLILLILFGVLRPVIRNLVKSIEPFYKLPATASVNVPALPEMSEDQVSLSGAQAPKRLEAPNTPFDKNMMTAQQAVKEDPKLVAQVVKNWVSEE
jgi:flagellar M-ring protein FliF